MEIIPTVLFVSLLLVFSHFRGMREGYWHGREDGYQKGLADGFNKGLSAAKDVEK